MELPYIVINGHGETLPTPLVIPPDTYLIRFSDIGVDITNLVDEFDTLTKIFCKEHVPELFEHNTSLHKTDYGEQLEERLHNMDPRIKLKIHLPGETTSDASIDVTDKREYVQNTFGIFKNQDGVIDTPSIKKTTLSDLFTFQNKGIYILMICRGIPLSQLEEVPNPYKLLRQQSMETDIKHNILSNPVLFFKHKKGRTPKHKRRKHLDEHGVDIVYPPAQEVDGGRRKKKHGGTIKLNKREKYYAKYGFTKKRNQN